jgi:hypothetical protein
MSNLSSMLDWFQSKGDPAKETNVYSFSLHFNAAAISRTLVQTAATLSDRTM